MVQDQAEMSSRIDFVHIAAQLKGLKSISFSVSAVSYENNLKIWRPGRRSKGRECSTPTGHRWYLRFPRSQRVKEREAPENVEARLVTGTGLLGHTLQGIRFSQLRVQRGTNP
jgi:hypothetical protein